MHNIFKTIGAAFLVVFMTVAGYADDGMHKLALQISDNDAQKMNTVLNVAANVTRYYSDKGEQVDVQIVAFNAGLMMLRTDKTPVADRLKSFNQSMPNVKFLACNNTREGMAKKEGVKVEDIPIIEGAEVVPAGVIALMDLNNEGYTVIRP
jgi:intracellular sulfur oxidation DsrE/DsrF family protein